MIELKEYFLSELYEMGSGISTKPEQAGHGAPFVSFSSIYNNAILPEELPDLMDTSIEEQEKYSVKEGDVFLTRTSETLDELAMSSVAVKDYPNATFSGFAKRLRPIQKNITYAKFMAFFMRSNYFRKIINCKAVMTLRASFNEEIFSYIKIELPSYEHQVKSGDLFYAIEQKIRNNNRINAALEAMAKTIYNYWFLQFEFPNKEGKPYKSSGGKMVWNEALKREIPEGWKVGILKDIADITMGSSPSGNSINEDKRGIIFYQGKTDFGYRFPQARLYTSEPKKYAEKNDILLSVRAPVGNLNVANEKCCIGRGLAAVHSKHQSFIYYLLSANQYQLNKYNDEGTTFGAINKDDLFGLHVIIPNSEIINMYENKIKCFDNKIFELSEENREIVSLRDFLLPLLMNGQVRFKQ